MDVGYACAQYEPCWPFCLATWFINCFNSMNFAKSSSFCRKFGIGSGSFPIWKYKSIWINARPQLFPSQLFHILGMEFLTNFLPDVFDLVYNWYRTARFRRNIELTVDQWMNDVRGSFRRFKDGAMHRHRSLSRRKIWDRWRYGIALASLETSLFRHILWQFDRFHQERSQIIITVSIFHENYGGRNVNKMP